MAGGSTTKGRASGEQVIEAALKARGVRIITHPEWTKEAKGEGVVVVRQFPFTTIYQTPGRVEFVIVKGGRPQTTLEVKHQSVSGSCDEKGIYVCANAMWQWPTESGILALSGDHWASARGLAAMAAMRSFAARLMPEGREFVVWDMTATLNWIARTF